MAQKQTKPNLKRLSKKVIGIKSEIICVPRGTKHGVKMRKRIDKYSRLWRAKEFMGTGLSGL